ncbi:MAG: SAM-dependent chlorinase/fluorinase, partial [Syntrophobacteraceae bacterium]|nr:SAM-dependent chlorinase/fluorinase [Syntrophobacteraceae bacterium]
LRQNWAKPKDGDGDVLAHVLHVDHFGNCVLSLRQGFDFAGAVASASGSMR